MLLLDWIKEERKKEDHGILEKIKGAFILEVSKGILWFEGN